MMGKLSLVNGIKQERVANVAAAKPARAILRKSKKESLYIILEVTGDLVGRDQIYREMIRIIGEEFFQFRGSVTAKLRQAIDAANSYLLQENLRALPHEQRAGGVTCAVLKEGNVYIAQAGPTTAYVSYQGKLSSFPETPTTERTAEEATPLGFKRGMPMRFYRSKVGLRDVILLTSGFLAQQTTQEQIAQAVVGQDVDRALANLEGLTGEGDASALLIRVAPVEERPTARPEAVRPTARPRVRPEALRPTERPKAEAPVKERLPRPDWSGLEDRMSSLLANALKVTGDFLKRLLPEEVPTPSKRVPKPRQPSRKAEKGRNLWMGAAIAIPVIVVILVAAVYWRQGVARQARFEQLMTQAQQEMEPAGQVDEATARTYLLKALGHLAEAEELRPGGPQVSELRGQTEYILKKIDKVTELQWIQPLWEYDEPGSDPGRVIIAKDIDIYVLDKSLDRVYKHLLDDTMHRLQELDVEPVLLRKGDQRDPIVVGDLVDMAWAKADGERLRGSLLVLESGGWLLEYDPARQNGISVLPIGGRDRWIQPQIAASYEGNFYLLDSSLNQILRYEPYYDEPPGDYFPTPGEVNLAGVVDMAIAGPTYLLYADGRILKFDHGQPAPFEITGLYEPLQNPTALFTSEETEFLYIADKGNKRILQLTKEGGFVRQFRAVTGEAFDDLKGLFAIEEFNLLYFVSGNKLYVTNIPSE
jgi:hypothetical protein